MKVDLTWIDYLIMMIYFVFVLGIGWFLRKFMKNANAFLEAGRSMPAWVAGLAFISTNLGALEVMGMTGSGMKYGMLTTHFYWIGAIPAMIFLALFMMPFYYGSKARSVPEFLKLRYDEKTRGLNAILFAVMTILASGISMYALAILMENILGWDFNVSLWISALIVLGYTYLGGLSSAIYNEVLQFFIIVIGLLPLVFLALKDVGGWVGLKEQLAPIATSNGFAAETYTTTWRYAGSAGANPLGVEWFGILFGLGFVLSFGYWCTNFLIVQRAFAAESKSAARKVPLIGAIPKMFIPFLIIVPGIIAIVLFNDPSKNFILPTDSGGVPIYDYTIIMLLKQYLPTGVLGLGITALLASFMSGMAGNVSAFNTVWTYDIYQSYMRPATGDEEADGKHYLTVGRVTTVVGVLLSIGAAYIASLFGNIMDFLQTIFSLVKGGWIASLHTYPVEMAQNFWTAIIAFAVSTSLTVGLSIMTKQKKTDEDLKGLVYSLTPRELSDKHLPWYERPAGLAILVSVICIVLTIMFW